MSKSSQSSLILSGNSMWKETRALRSRSKHCGVNGFFRRSTNSSESVVIISSVSTSEISEHFLSFSYSFVSNKLSNYVIMLLTHRWLRYCWLSIVEVLAFWTQPLAMTRTSYAIYPIVAIALSQRVLQAIC